LTTTAFVSGFSGPGGPVISLLELIRGVPKPVVLVAPRGYLSDRLRELRPDATVLNVPHWPRAQPIARLVTLVRLTSWGILRRRSLVLHANGLAEWVAALPLLALGVPVVTWIHNSELPRGLRHVRVPSLLVRRTNWVAVSEHAAAVVESAPIRATGVRIIPNPVWRPDHPLRRPSDDGEVVIGYFGAALRNKGFHLLPDFVSALADVPVRWLVFTNSRRRLSEEPIWERLKEFGADRVELIGRVQDAYSGYARCDVVFCPSLRESFCRVAVEAMAAGIPVVASDLPPLREWIGDQERGLLFPPGDIDLGASALRRLSDKDLRAQLGDRGRQFASRFDPDRVRCSFARVYSLARHHARPVRDSGRPDRATSEPL
jgi:phosphatidyl-myo-inositol alpha-mannosyltransferase